MRRPRPFLAFFLAFGIALAAAAAATATVTAELPQGYLVWSRGTADDPGSRKIVRLTLPDRSDERTLTAGEDVEPQVSPDGKWVAYAKAKFPGGSDYHDFRLWKVYVVSVHGAGAGRREIKIDDDGAWPSWSRSGALFYNQAAGTHTRLIRVELDDRGRVASKRMVADTGQLFGTFAEVNEAAIAPDESWFAARTRGNSEQNGVGAFTLEPSGHLLLARAGAVGCMPRVAPDGTFGLIAGATEGIRWGHGPKVSSRKEDQLLIRPRSPSHYAYHPGISTDGLWILASQGADGDHNGGRYDLGIHKLDPEAMTVGEEQVLTAVGFNGWPHLWVGAPSAPPPPRPEVSEFWASSYTIAPDEAATLTWTTFGADQVLLDGTAVMPEGTQEVRASATKSFTLLAQSGLDATSDARSLSITVNATPQPVSIGTFSADPARIEQGQSTTLRWAVDNATTLTLDGQRASPMETREVSPMETTTYVLTAQGHSGPAQATVTVTVVPLTYGLLPDRGGFRCTMGARAAGGGGTWVIALLGLMAVARARAGARARARIATTTRPPRTTRSPRP